MTILTVVRDVCAAVGVAIPPTSVFASLAANRTMQEMVALANEMAQRIAYDTRDWTMLSAYASLDGSSSDPIIFGASSFPLPANYKRLLLTSNVWLSTSPQQPMRFISDYDEWSRRRYSGQSEGSGEWINLGGTMWVYPTVPSGVQVLFFYLDRNCVNLESGGVGDRFVADGDSFRLDERLLKLGMIWQWKALKGSPYAEDMGTYSDAIATAMGHDKPSPIIIGRKPISSTARISGSWPVGWGAA